MAEHCLSCTAPLKSPEFKGNSDTYCKWCSDEQGNLKPRADVQAGIAHWFGSWQPNVTKEQAMERAGHFMKAMPAWADN